MEFEEDYGECKYLYEWLFAVAGISNREEEWSEQR